MTGAGSTPWYDGRTFVRSGDVVVVTLNYRLGALGFLHLADLGGEAYASSGNCGILDQVAALAWVRDNIAALGGDPSNVTLFGESAGAMSIGTLLGMPAARGLFRRAILQSGACANVSRRERATRIAVETLDALGLDAHRLGALRSVPVERLLSAQEKVATGHNRRFLPYQPVVDGLSLPRQPLDAVTDGSAEGVPVMCGTTLEEMKLFTMLDGTLVDVDGAGLVERARPALGDRAEEVVNLYRAERPEATNADLWTALATDSVFRIPAIRLLQRQAAVTADCWAYLFTMRSTAFGGALGACHGLDIPFVFDNLARPGVNLFTGEPPGASELASRMHRSWLAFASTGHPGHDDLPSWPRYDTDRRATMEFGEECRVLDDPMGVEREAWA
jgi:para-nitrobenzyl esterase